MNETIENQGNSGNFVKTDTEEMSKALPKVDESKLINNPFSNDLVIKATKRIDPKAKVKDAEGNDIPAWSLVDKAKSVKLYQSAVYRNRTLSLSGGGMRMLFYIIYEIEQGKDWIQMLPEQYLSRGGKGSKSSYLRAVEELVTEGYITTTLQKYVYWVNPIMVFAGNRIGKYPDKVIVANEHSW